MRFLPIIILSLFSATLFAQGEPLGKEELKKFRDYEGSQINFEYDELISNYIYTTQVFDRKSADVTLAQVKLRAFIEIVKNEDDYCFGAISLAANLYRQGQGCTYNSVQVLIGFPSNIKKGDAVEYTFDLESDDQGNSIIEGEEVAEFISKAMEMKRPINLNFFNADEQLASMTIAYAKVTQKMGGIIKTRDNLYEQYIMCQD